MQTAGARLAVIWVIVVCSVADVVSVPAYRRAHVHYARGMRFTGLLVAGGSGMYCALTLIGLGVVVTGRAFSNADWLAGVPGLMLLGGLTGVVVARWTRGWLRAALGSRGLVVAGAGAATLPLALAPGVLDDLNTAATSLLFLGWLVGVTLYVTACRRAGRRRADQRRGARQPESSRPL